MLEEFELAVGAFREDRRAEGFHNLLDGDGCACELVFCRTEQGIWSGCGGDKESVERGIPYKAKCAFKRGERRAGGMKDERDDGPMPTGWRSTYLVVTWDRGMRGLKGKTG